MLVRAVEISCSVESNMKIVYNLGPDLRSMGMASLDSWIYLDLWNKYHIIAQMSNN